MRAVRPLKARVDLALILCLGCVYLLTYSGRLHSIDEVSVLTTASQIARTGEFHINQIYWMGDAIQVGKVGLDGNLYSKHSILWALLSVPWLWVATQLASVGNVEVVLVEPLLVTLLTAWLVFRTARRLDLPEFAAAAGALTFGLATLAWPYSKYFFSEPLSALLLSAAVYGMVVIARGGSLRWWATTGVAFGLAGVNRPTNLFFAAVPLGFLLLRAFTQPPGSRQAVLEAARRGTVRVAGLLVPLAICFIPAGLYNWWRFGHVLDSGYPPLQPVAVSVPEIVWGLLLSPGKGVIWYAPACLLGAAGWLLLTRRDQGDRGDRRYRGLIVTLGLATATYVVLLAVMARLAAWHVWWGGLNWGPRYLVPLMPLVGIGSAAWLAHCPPRRWLWYVSWACLGLSVLAQVPAVLTDHVPYEIALYQELGQDWQRSPALNDPARSPLVQQWRHVVITDLETWWSRGGGPVWPLALTLAGLLAGLLLAVALRRRFTISDRSFASAVVGTALLAIGALMIGRA